ncbi:response regulator [Mesobacillus subterraneus]|uniref:response regulator transcription factor n=1 Tax=Mesobacillus subterraneus TaxID=285983 RepID=UPI00203C7CEE|nr:response regulator [Mesobacillus subterraneus]MCM3665813.1 response regulator [Mesobacillus subterraneus]MCM3684796.1 response regulator [Mesobacillus subterraneus]
MYNVFIVDDEPVIRFGLKASVDWDAEGLKLVGDYPNGEEALSAMEEYHPDILITDIKMPVMDGITLMKKAKSKFPNLKVILVSSYNDFDFVREGLKLGAIDYVLKPTLEPKDFVQLIRKTVEKIQQEESIEEQLGEITETRLAEERRQMENSIKRAILSGQQLESGDFPDWLKGKSLIVYMELNHLSQIEEEFGGLFKSFILDEIQTQFYKNQSNRVCFPIGDSQMLFLLGDERHGLQIVEELKMEIEQETKIDCSFSYMPGTNLDSIKESYLLLEEACGEKFFDEKRQIFQVEPSKTTIKSNTMPSLNMEDSDDLTELFEERTGLWDSGLYSEEAIKNDACHMLTNFYMNQVSINILVERCRGMESAETLSELISQFRQDIIDFDDLILENKKKVSTDNELVDKALDYIHKHYTEELTLQRVADHIHISRNYFSIIFKRFKVKNFIDYVIELRVNKARELLKETSLKVYEVAEKSGFRDVKYFSKVFKKLTGLSPVDYRTESLNKRMD